MEPNRKGSPLHVEDGDKHHSLVVPLHLMSCTGLWCPLHGTGYIQLRSELVNSNPQHLWAECMAVWIISMLC